MSEDSFIITYKYWSEETSKLADDYYIPALRLKSMLLCWQAEREILLSVINKFLDDWDIPTYKTLEGFIADELSSEEFN